MDYLSLPSYPLVPLPQAFQDARGSIQNLVTGGIASAVLITSRRGSERANHWHREDDHLCYVVSGELDYYWQALSRDHGGKAPLEGVRKVQIGAGKAFYTPPYCAHTMHFTKDTAFVVLSGKCREPKQYEDDLVRIPSLRPPDELPLQPPPKEDEVLRRGKEFLEALVTAAVASGADPAETARHLGRINKTLLALQRLKASPPTPPKPEAKREDR